MSDRNEKEKLLSDTCTCDLNQDKCKMTCNCKGKCGRCKHKTNYKGYYDDTGSDGTGSGIFHRGRAGNISAGAANILSQNLKYAVYICVSLLLLLFIIILCILALRLKHRNFDVKVNASIVMLHRRNALCKEISQENASAFLQWNLEASNYHKSEEPSDPRRNLFYIIDTPLSKEQACNVESVLQLLPDKLIYIIEMYNENMKTSVREIDYITYLQKFYNNLNRIQIDKKQFFRGSIFENRWEKSDSALSTFAAKVLSIWQFGGTVLSEDLIMNSRDIFDKPNNMCMADKDLIYCPHECSAYSYDLMKEILNKMKNSYDRNWNLEKLIDESISEACSEGETNVGCKQVYRLQKTDMCDGKSNSLCQFIRVDKLRKMTSDALKEFCHHVGKILG